MILLNLKLSYFLVFCWPLLLSATVQAVNLVTLWVLLRIKNDFLFNPKKISKSTLKITQDLNLKAKNLIAENRLIKPGEEVSGDSLLTKWGVVKSVKYVDLLN